MSDRTVLKIRDLRTSFFTSKGEVKAVDGVNIDIPEGKIIGIVGESGCGKSMTAMSIMGLLKHPGRIVGGSIELEGRELTGLGKRELAAIRGSELSMIFQEPMTSLNPVITVGNQVAEALRVHQKLKRAEAKKRVLEIFAEVGISEPEKRYGSYPHQLSGGLRQRVMIAMAMICRPKVLIADEPTTALDVTIEAQILRLMRRLCDDYGTSVIIITHNMGVVAELCDYVYVMYAGRIMEQAETFRLFENTSHPYTKGLLRSVPRLDEKAERLYTIEGTVPSMLRLPAGCCFEGRCDEAAEHCKCGRPELYDISEADGSVHRVSCFKYGGGESLE